MPFTYSGNPSSSTLDEIRFLLQDTDSTDPLFQDAEITYEINKFVGLNGSTYRAAAGLAETLGAKFAREVAISSDGTSVAMEALQQKYMTLAAQLRQRAAKEEATGNGPIVGGVNYDDDSYSGPPKRFSIAMHDNSQAGRQDGDPGPDSYYLDYELGGFITY